MKTALGLVALREIAKNFGPVEVAFVPSAEPDPWLVSLSDKPLCRERGSALEATASALLDRLEREREP